MADVITPLAIHRPFAGDPRFADMVRSAVGPRLLVAPREAPSPRAIPPSNALAQTIGRMNADASFRQAWQADSWLALACHDLIHQPTS